MDREYLSGLLFFSSYHHHHHPPPRPNKSRVMLVEDKQLTNNKHSINMIIRILFW